MSDAGTQVKEAERPAALGADGAALLSADDFAAALAEIENNGPLAPKPQAPPKPGRSLGGVDTAEAPGEVEAESPQPEPVPPSPGSVATPAEPADKAVTVEATGPTANATVSAKLIDATAATIPAPSTPGELVPAAAPAPVSPPPATGPAPPGLKFKIGKKGAEVPTAIPGSRTAAAASVSTPAAVASALDLPTMSPTVRLGKRFIRWAEGVLDAVHRPLEGINPRLLPILGVCALTTIGVSALSLVAFPILFPSRDAISYLEERVTALDAPKVEKPNPEADGHGAEKPKKDAADGHGETKPKKKDDGDGHGEAKAKKKAGGDGHSAAAAKPAAATKSAGAKKSSAAH